MVSQEREWRLLEHALAAALKGWLVSAGLSGSGGAAGGAGGGGFGGGGGGGSIGSIGSIGAIGSSGANGDDLYGGIGDEASGKRQRTDAE